MVISPRVAPLAVLGYKHGIAYGVGHPVKRSIGLRGVN